MMDQLFPTMVVGSLPRPVFIRELIERRKCGEVSEAEADLVLDDAVPAAIQLRRLPVSTLYRMANGVERAT